MPAESILQRIGLNQKETQIYLKLLEAGQSSVRTLALTTGVNRGTTYDTLKSLLKKGLVSYYHKNTHQYFVAENPERLKEIIEQNVSILERSRRELESILPNLRSLIPTSPSKPVVKYYEGATGIKAILQDVIDTMSSAKTKEYYAYSAADVREHLYTDFPNFAKKRIAKKIRVKVIALGSGGKLWGMDERKWLTKTESSPAYIIIYEHKMAIISFDEHKKLHGILMADATIAETQRVIFEHVYSTLPNIAPTT